MPIAEINGTTPIGAGVLNTIIRAVNKIESSNLFNGKYANTGTIYASNNDNVAVLGQRAIVTGIDKTQYWHNKPYIVTFDQTFIVAPVVTVTVDSTAGAYIAPYIHAVRTNQVELGFIRLYGPETGATSQRLPASLGVNVIAVGPVANIT